MRERHRIPVTRAPTQLTWPDGYFVTYDYDSLDRMLDVKEGGTATVASFTYDALSRRKSLAYPHSGSAYGCSPAGDLTSLAHTVASGPVPTYTLGYTLAHRLASEASSQSSYNYTTATVATDSYGTSNLPHTEYDYDALGRIKQVGPPVSRAVYDLLVLPRLARDGVRKPAFLRRLF